MATNPKPTAASKTPKMMDVAAPGKSAPSTSSKPIIVSNRPILKRDPMVKGAGELEAHNDITPVSRTAKTIKVAGVDPLMDDAQQPVAEVPAANAPAAPTITDLMSKKITIQPLASTEPTEAAQPAEAIALKEGPASLKGAKAAKDVGVEAVASVMPEPAAAEAPKTPEPRAPAKVPESTPPAEPTPAVSDSTDGEEDDGDGQLAPNQIVDQAKRKEEDAKATKLAEQDKLVASHEYFLPIKDTEKRVGLERTIFILVIVLILTAVWLDLVLDAGILHINGLQSFTHFFSH